MKLADISDNSRAARAGDSSAELAAEKESEYQEAFRAGSDYSEHVESVIAAPAP